MKTNVFNSLRARILGGGVTLLAVLVLGLALSLPGGLVRAQDSSTIEYDENGTGPVAAFTADDPEDDTITWSVASTGTEDFKIDSDGVLEFITPPNYEDPEGGTGNDSNTYTVVVTATDTADPVNTDMFTVTVEVKNVEEDGVVAWTVDPDGFDTGAGTAHTAGTPPALLQFQPGASLMARLTDGDAVVPDTNDDGNVTNVRWQWYRSPSATAMGTAISGATSDTYTVQDEVGDSDVGMYLRVEASYTVVAGSAESASRVSDYPVQMFREDNSAPEFSPTSVTREVSEGMSGMDVGNPVTGTDADGGALNYTIDTNARVTVDGTPTDAFAIDQETGQITTALDLDYDTPADPDQASDFTGVTGNAAGDNIYLISVRATDSAGAATGGINAGDPADATVAITLKNVDEKPEFTVTAGTVLSPPAITRNEDNTTLFESGATGGQPTTAADVTYAATDPEGRTVSLTLTGDDEDLFRLTTDSVLEFRTGPDYEDPSDSNGDNKYEVTVRASDGTMYMDQDVTVTVTDAPEAPEIDEVDTPIEYDENGTDPAVTLTAVDPEGDTVMWSLTGGADQADFAIDDESGELSFAIGGTVGASPDFENPVGGTGGDSNTYEVTVQASDGTNANSITVTVEVQNVAEDGMITWSVDPAGPLTAIGVNGGDPIVQFQPGAVLTVTQLTDGDVSGGTKTIAEGDTNWQWYRSSSKTSQGSPISGATTDTYIVQDETNNNDVGRYIRVVASYSVVAGDSSTAYRVSDYPVQRRLGENNSAPEFNPDEVDREVTEGMAGMDVGAPVTATDADRDALNYMLAGTGADNAKFEIDAKTGQITTMWGLDREGAAEASAEAAGTCAGTPSTECTVTITVTDSAGATDTATVTITITNVDEKPEFTERATGATTGIASPKAISSPEGRSALWDGTDGPVTTEDGVTYEAMDEDGNLVNLSLMGDDGELFTLDAPTTGGGSVLAFAAAPDFESPTDRNGDNKYQVTVRASDGTKYADHEVTVTVTDVNEAPEVTAGLAVSGPTSERYAENDTDAVGTYTARGQGADSATWSLEGDDEADFNISSDGELTFAVVPDFENPADADGDNEYMVTVKAEAGDESDTIDVTVTVTNVAEGPTFIEGATATRSVAENTAAGENIGAPVVATPDTETTIASYALGGTDAASFGIDSATGQLMTSAALDYEDQNSYSVTVTAADLADMDAMITLTITVTNVNEAPEFATATTTRSVDENTAAGEDIGAPVTATDVDAGDTLTYTLGGTDAASFGIGGSSGQLTTSADLDFETKASYSVTVTATDAGGLSDSIDVTIMVTDVEEGLLARYDADNSGEIEKEEAIAAINDYLFGEGDDAISKADAIEVINLYLFGELVQRGRNKVHGGRSLACRPPTSPPPPRRGGRG